MAHAGRYLILALACVALSGAKLSGAQGRYAVDVSFTVLADSLLRDVWYLPEPGEEPVELKFFSSQRSKAYEYRGPNPLVFFREVPAAPDPARPNVPRMERVTVGYVEIPQGMREALILFTSDGTWSENSIPLYRVQVFDDSRQALPEGHVAFLNATGQALSGSLGDRQLYLGGPAEVMALAPGETPVTLHMQINGSWVPVYHELLALGPKQRLAVVLFPSRGSERTYLRRKLLYDPNRRPVIERPNDGGG